MTSQTITIPAREVRPGDVLFGMTVSDAYASPIADLLTTFDFGAGVSAVMVHTDSHWTVERPVPSDPIGTVRARFDDGQCIGVYRKSLAGWQEDGLERDFTDADVAKFPILWKPGMPIPNTEVTA